MKKIWKSWKKIINKATNFQAGVVLTVIYIIFIVPISFVINSRNTMLNRKDKKNIRKSYWVAKERHQDIKTWAKKL